MGTCKHPSCSGWLLGACAGIGSFMATRHVCYYAHFAERDPEAPKVTVTFRSEHSWGLS